MEVKSYKWARWFCMNCWERKGEVNEKEFKDFQGKSHKDIIRERDVCGVCKQGMVLQGSNKSAVGPWETILIPWED
jgi:hypothetical protein